MSSPTQRTLLAIDPGTEKSAWVTMDPADSSVEDWGYDSNEGIRLMLRDRLFFLVIEDVKSYGMPVGASVFEMAKWMGRFQQANGEQAVYIANSTIRQQICKSSKAKDCHIRQALIDRYGGKEKAIGTKKKGYGPLHGMTQDGHHWSALAVGVTYLEQGHLAAR